MNRRVWIAGLVVLGGVGWYLFRPELLFLNKQVNVPPRCWVGASTRSHMRPGVRPRFSTSPASGCFG
jgi:hypothetical protein